MNTAEGSPPRDVVVRFAGDSGDGMQVVGSQFTRTTALVGNDLATLPDFPAEIRAPAGTPEGVSGFQLRFASQDVYTPGDLCDLLFAMNPAALVTNLRYLRPGGIVVVNTDRLKDADLAKARLTTNPLDDGTLDGFRPVPAPLSTLAKEAVAPLGLGAKDADRCKNFFALGMACWIYERPLEPTEAWIARKFRGVDAEANRAALRAGFEFAHTIELFHEPVRVPPARFPPGTYRQVTGNQALGLALAAAAHLSGRTVLYASYPITPASDILHHASAQKAHGVATFQAEDEIAAVAAALGAAWGGHLGVTGTSGPGLVLKAEAMGLGVMVELPVVVICVQRGGPSTGLPTKTEQADLLLALYGRHGEAPVPVLAPRSPADCFDTLLEAFQIAIERMVPVILLSDGFLANGAEPWRLPDPASLPDLRPKFATEPSNFLPYARDPQTLARPWAIPGTPGLEHRIGGLEKADGTGMVSYDPLNHEKMCRLRAEKVRRVQESLPPAVADGDPDGVLVVSWGGTWGSVRTAVERCRAEGHRVGHLHLRHLNPFPPGLGPLLRQYRRVLVPELNLGQLDRLLKAEFGVEVVPLHKIQGLPFFEREVLEPLRALCAEVSS